MTTATLSSPVSSIESINGCNIRIDRGGAGNRTLLFLHGAGGSAGLTPDLELLATDFDVIAPEHPGFGKSDDPAWFNNIHDLAYFYLDFLKQKKLSNVHLVACSLGGWIALEMAVRSTERLASLTLISPAGIHLKGVKRPDTFMWTWEQSIRGLYADVTIAERLLAQERTDEDIELSLKNRFATAKVGWAPRFHNPDLDRWLHRVDVPTLIVWGKKDAILPVAYADYFKTLMPRAEVSIFEDAGHLPHIEQPTRFAKTFRNFIERNAK